MTDDPSDGPQLDSDRIPRHVAVIMDGNGRWAAQRGEPRRAGHAAGEAALWDTVQGAVELGIGCLTVYAFSTENWRRPPSEVRFLMNFNRDLLVRRADDLDALDVRVRFIGRRGLPVPPPLVRLIERTERRTAENTGMLFQVAFNYGAQQELADAARRIAEEVAAGTLPPRQVDEDCIAGHLYHPTAPPVDLLVRTSGEQRISNFLLWQAAYAELVFCAKYWPDFTADDFDAALAEYERRERRFGG
jgi:undecaprenyl diphosphate synthase